MQATNPARRRLTVRLGAAVAVSATVGALVLVPQASAELDGNSAWEVTARADAMAIEYLNTASPVFAEEPVIYGTPATAASRLSSAGESSAFAGGPYPGDIMVGMPDNGNGVMKGAGLPGLLPSYAFFVSSSHGLRDEEVKDQSGNRLEAHSAEDSSESAARTGLITGDFLAALQAQAASSASADHATGLLVGTADSQLDAFRFTDAVQIGKSTAHARIVREPGKAVVKESSFTLGSISIGGQELSYSDKGFKFADQPPSAPPGDPTPLFKALEQAGITIEVLPAHGTDTSIESAGLKISQLFDFKAGKQRISLIIGRVRANIAGEAKVVDDALAGFPPIETTGSEPAAATAPSAGPIGVAPIVTPSYDLSPPVSAAAPYRVASSAPRALPDLSLPSPVNDQPATPAFVESASPTVEEQASAKPEVRLIKPASVGRSLRDDDYGGLLAVGTIVALLGVGVFVALIAGGGGGAAAAGGSALKFPGA